MMKYNSSAGEIARLLRERAEMTAQYLMPNGKKRSGEWYVGSINGEVGESLKICLQGDSQGVWADFATNDRGDLLSLWALNRRISLSQAISEAKQWLGISNIDFVACKPKFERPATDKLPPHVQLSAENYLMQSRKLSSAILKQFDIRSTESDIIFPYWRDGELIQIKYLSLQRLNNKKMIRTEAKCEQCLFGWSALTPTARVVTITEGEIDAMTLSQYGIPALSVPYGAGGKTKHQWLENDFDRLSIFDVIYLCFDQDDAGQQAVKELVERLGQHRCRIVSLPFKDANECLQQGMTSEKIKYYFDQASSIDPEELKSAHIFVDQVIAEFYSQDNNSLGVSPPWEKAIGKVAFRPAELSLWTGINSHGKSQFIGQIILASMKQNKRVCVASLELKPARLLMRLTRQASAVSEPSPDYIRAIHEWYENKLWLFNVVGNTKTQRLLEVFLYAKQRYGIEIFVIDSLMKCGIFEDNYNAQKSFVEELCDFKNTYDCHIHLIAHPRKGSDENNVPSKLDIKGSGAISDLADNAFTVWRNKPKENEIQKILAQNQPAPNELLEKPDCLWVCDKQRNGEWEGRVSLWFDPKSFQYLNYRTQKPTRYVEFSNVNVYPLTPKIEGAYAE